MRKSLRMLPLNGVQLSALAFLCAINLAVPGRADEPAKGEVVAKPKAEAAAAGPLAILDRNHHLGPGDVIDIVVDGYPQFSKTVKLFADGSFDFPVLDTVQAVGLTTKELRDRITDGFRKELRRPVVYVTLNSVYVPPPPPPVEVKIPKIVALGAITKKGQIDLPQPRPLRQVIQELGPTERADLSSIRIRNSDGSARIIDASSFTTMGEFKDDILIKGGEEIIVVERPEVQRPEPIRVQVLGNVSKTGFVTFEGSAPILEVLEKAGGPKQGSAMDRIKVLSGNTEHFVDVEKYMRGDVSANYFCRNGDIITVLTKPLQVLVFGEVPKPGEVAINEGESLARVLLGTGVNSNADKAHVELIREGKDGKVERQTINVTNIERQAKNDVTLLRGDVIFVRPRVRKKGIVDYLSAIATPLWLLRSITPGAGF